MTGPHAPLPAADFAEFFRVAYQPLVRDVIFAGWNLPEAEDAVSTAMAAVLQHWDKIDNPRAYAPGGHPQRDQEQGTGTGADPGTAHPAGRYRC
jgi:hypothetical protein